MDILKKHTAQVVFSVLMALIGVGCGVLPYFAVADIIKLIISGSRQMSDYLPEVYLAAAGFAGGVLFHFASTLASHNLAFGIIETSRKLLALKLTKLPMGLIEGKSSGQWAQFMTDMLNNLERPIAHVIPEVIANLAIPVVLVITVFTFDWRIGFANLLTLPLGFIFIMLMMKGYEAKSRRYQEASKNMNTALVEYIRGINIIKVFNKSASSYEKFKEAVEENKNAMLDWYLSVCFSVSAAMEVLPSTLVFVLPISLYLYMKGGVDESTLITCVLLSYATYRPLIKAMSHADNMANINVIISEIDKVMKLPELKRGKTKCAPENFTVEFKNVSFGYNKDSKVFDGLSFKAEEGRMTAIVGYSGSGKSTITKLIAGFWNVDSGSIQIGGVDLNSMPLKQNMELVTYVSQENFLFQKSIADNMRLAKPEADLKEIEEVCKRASCHDFIASLPEGYNTMVQEAGGSLSGGERQRITIARALLKNSPVILLDEATAYSDPDNEAVIQKSINALVKDKTVIMVAHRLSTIMNADKIIVLNHGSIAAEGTHKELLEECGIYKKMWQSHIKVRQEAQ